MPRYEILMAKHARDVLPQIVDFVQRKRQLATLHQIASRPYTFIASSKRMTTQEIGKAAARHRRHLEGVSER